MRDIDPTTGRRTATDKRDHYRMAAGFFTLPGKMSHIADPVERMATLALHVASVEMSLMQGSNGHISPEAALEATGLPPQYAKTMITDGAWHEADHGCPRCPQPRQDLVYVHDYLEHNRSAEQQQRTSQRRRAGGAKGGAARWAGHVKPDNTAKRKPGRPRKIVDGVHPAEARAAAAAAKQAVKQEEAATVYDVVVLQLCDELAAMVKLNGFSVGKVGPAWWKPCEQLLRIGPPNADEGVSPEQIRKAIRWANEDGFWWQNIRSMQQLREKYEQLRAAAKDPNRPKRGTGGALQRRGGPQRPAALAVSGLGDILARQMGVGRGGMVKGVQR